MGGNIEVQSAPQQGTTFLFTIKTTASDQSLRTYVHNNFMGVSKRKILVVDDNATNLTIIKSQLEQWQQIPYLASSGKEALFILSENSLSSMTASIVLPLWTGSQFIIVTPLALPFQ